MGRGPGPALGAIFPARARQMLRATHDEDVDRDVWRGRQVTEEQFDALAGQVLDQLDQLGAHRFLMSATQIQHKIDLPFSDKLSLARGQTIPQYNRDDTGCDRRA